MLFLWSILDYANTLRLFPVSVVLYCFNGEAAGPLSTAPVVLKTDPCAEQLNLLLLGSKSIVTC